MNPIVKNLIRSGFKPTKKTGEGIKLNRADGSFAFYKGNGRIEGLIKGGLDANDSLDEGTVSSSLLMAILLGTAATYFTTDLTIVDGHSMEPTLTNLQVIVNSKSNVNKMITKGCVIKFKDYENDTCIKRVVGMPGERVTQTKHGLAINGQIVDKDTQWITGRKGVTTPEISSSDSNMDYVLAKNEYFVMGDNRNYSTDSRHVGPIHQTKILSVIVR